MSLISAFQKICACADTISRKNAQTSPSSVLRRATIESWLLLFRFEIIMRLCSSAVLRRTVQNEPIRHTAIPCSIRHEELSHAVDLACVFYFKRVRCLQRSAATTILLRRYGWEAKMVTGACILPDEFHAWVEVDDLVVNDRPYMNEIYQVLERC